MNIAGLIVIAGGIALIVIALRNTQSSIFPWFFTSPGSTSSGSTPVIGSGGTGVAGLGCPPCYSPFVYLGIQWCKLDSVGCLLTNHISTANVSAILPMSADNSAQTAQ